MLSRENYDDLYEDLLASEKEDSYVFKSEEYSFTLGDLKFLYFKLFLDPDKISEVLNLPISKLRYLLNLYNIKRSNNFSGEEILFKKQDLIKIISAFPTSEVLEILKITSRQLDLVLKVLDDIPTGEDFQDKIKLEGKYLKSSYFTDSGHMKWKMHHRKIVEDELGRPLGKSEVVHHIDCNKINNNFSNLCVCSSQDHTLLHRELENIGRLMFHLGYVKFQDGHYVLDLSRLDENLLYEYGKSDLNHEDIRAELN